MTITDPNIGFILLFLGVLGIYAEFASPGLVIPGVAGAVLAMLGLSSLSALSINWMGVALLLLALGLFALEAKFTSHGALGFSGALAMTAGALTLVNGPPDKRISLATALAVTVPFACITVVLASLAWKARANKVLTGVQGLIDQHGVTRTALAPAGQVFVRGEYWRATSTRDLPEGEPVRVTGVAGMTLHVEPVRTDK